MDRMLYTAMSGAKQNMLAQAINANNLANISTTGFRADLAAARSMPTYGNGHPSRVYAMTEKPGIDFSSGALNSTGRDLDVAISGEGFFAVQAKDGSEAYTRAGDFYIDSAGTLMTAAGNAVIGEGGPIVIPPSTKIDIGKDGVISSVGENPDAIAVIDRIKLVNPDAENIRKSEQGLFVLKDGTTADVDEDVSVISGTLETSNVNAASALVNMIEIARQFEMQVKMLKTAEENNSRASQIMRLA